MCIEKMNKTNSSMELIDLFHPLPKQKKSMKVYFSSSNTDQLFQKALEKFHRCIIIPKEEFVYMCTGPFCEFMHKDEEVQESNGPMKLRMRRSFLAAHIIPQFLGILCRPFIRRSFLFAY